MTEITRHKAGAILRTCKRNFVEHLVRFIRERLSARHWFKKKSVLNKS